MATLDIDDEEIKELVDKLHSVEVAVEGTEIMVHFSDREQETAMFIKRVLGYPGIAAIYGPRGAGKTTLLKLLVEGAKEVGGSKTSYLSVTNLVKNTQRPTIRYT